MGRNIINASSILESSRGTPVILACGYTDMRKSVNGLSSIVENQLKLNPYQKVLFVFCNKQRNRLKVLVWEDNKENWEGICVNFSNLKKLGIVQSKE